MKFKSSLASDFHVIKQKNIIKWKQKGAKTNPKSNKYSSQVNQLPFLPPSISISTRQSIILLAKMSTSSWIIARIHFIWLIGMWKKCMLLTVLLLAIVNGGQVIASQLVDTIYWGKARALNSQRNMWKSRDFLPCAYNSLIAIHPIQRSNAN